MSWEEVHAQTLTEAWLGGGCACIHQIGWHGHTRADAEVGLVPASLCAVAPCLKLCPSREDESYFAGPHKGSPWTAVGA